MKTFVTRKNVYHTAALVLVTALAIGLFSACAKKSDPNIDKITVILGENVISQPLVGIAREKGYFTEYGLDLTTVLIETGAIEALEANRVDMLLTGIIPSLSFAARGSSVKIIGGTASGGNYIVAKPELAAQLRNDPNFELWNDKKLGLVRLSTSEMVTRYALGQRGFDLHSRVKLVEIETYPNIIEGVRKGEVDIGYVSSEYSQQLAAQGLEIVFPMTHLMTDYVCCRITVSDQAYKNKRAAIVKFLKGVTRAYKDYIEDPEGTVKILAAASRQNEQFAYNLLYNPDTYADRKFNPHPNLNGIRSIYGTLVQWGYVPNNGVTVDDFVDISLFEEALNDILQQYPNEPIFQQLQAEFVANNF